MRETKKDYIPALSYDFLTPFYDPLIKLGLRETAFKTALLNQADILPGQRVLDLACGTGTLTVMAKKANPQAEMIGLDGDRSSKSPNRKPGARTSPSASTRDFRLNCHTGTVSSTARFQACFFTTSSARTNAERLVKCVACWRQTANCTSPIGANRTDC